MRRAGCGRNLNPNPHGRKGGGLVLILDFSRETLFPCPFQIVFSHSSLMVKPHACRVRHEECQVSLIQLGPSGRSFRLRTVLKVGSKGEKRDVRLMLGTMQSDEKSKKRKGTAHERDEHSKKTRVA